MLNIFDRYREYGALFIRIVVGVYLIYGVQDNILSHDRMVEFKNFLALNDVPYPMIGAYVSAYAQFIAGLLFIVGGLTRYAAILMIINFIVAFIVWDLKQPYKASFPAQVMLASALFLLFNGAGKPSIDSWLARKK